MFIPGLCLLWGAHRLHLCNGPSLLDRGKMCALVNLTENWVKNTGWDNWSCSTDTTAPSLLSVYLCIDPYLLPFVIHCWRLTVLNMHNSQRVTSYIMSRNLFRRTPSFDRWNIDFGCKCNTFSCQYLYSWCRGERNCGNMMF